MATFLMLTDCPHLSMSGIIHLTWPPIVDKSIGLVLVIKTTRSGGDSTQT